MIKCPECGADNLLGAIFCRGCGEKLDIDNLKPDQLESKGKKTAKKTATIIRNIITLVILLILGALVAGVLVPPSYTKPSPLSEEAETKARASYNSLANSGSGSATFSVDELNFFATGIAKLTPEDIEERAMAAAETDSSPKFVPKALFLQPQAPGNIKFVLKGNLFGKLPLHLSVTGPVTIDEEKGGASFTPSSITVGRIPVVGGYLQQVAKDQFTPLLQDNAKFDTFRSRILDKIRSADISATSVTLQK